MPIQGPRNPFNNPFQQQPQFGAKAPLQGPQQPRKNPFETTSSGGSGQPNGDHFDVFKAQLTQGSIQPNLSQPRPAAGVGDRLLTVG